MPLYMFMDANKTETEIRDDFFERAAPIVSQSLNCFELHFKRTKVKAFKLFIMEIHLTAEYIECLQLHKSTL